MDEQDSKRLISHSGVKGNVRYITITDNVSEHWDDLIYIAKSNYTWYAYIFHDKDDVDKHIHLLCYDKGGTNLRSHCSRFSTVIPPNFVCKVFNPRAMARYLCHKDNPEKFQYSPNLIITNSKDKLFGFFREENSDVLEQYRDYKAVLSGLMSPSDFYDKYRSEINSMPFYHRCSLFHRLSACDLQSRPPLQADSLRVN